MNAVRARAPGRVNLIGDHTDYNDGFVLPCAIDFATTVTASARNDRRVTLSSNGFSRPGVLDLDDLAHPQRGDWSEYVRGMLIELERDGARFDGADLAIESAVPVGAGLSSSAALEMASGLAMLALAGQPIDRVALAKAGRRAENEHVGARVGIMDQFVSANARAGYALLLDTRTLETRDVPIPDDIEIVIANTMVKHQLSAADGGYNQRRSQCEKAVAVIAAQYPNVRALRDVDMRRLEEFRDELGDEIFRRCRHVIAENARVLEAADALLCGEFTRVGELMRQSHASLRDDYEVSCRELDTLVEIAATIPHLYGARMTGGGFGGCTVNLVDATCVQECVQTLRSGYQRATGIVADVYVTRAAEGAMVL